MANCRKRSSLSHLAAVVSVATLLLTIRRAAAAEAEPPIHLHFYMHDVVTGPGATAAEVVNGTAARFGKVVVMDDLLTEGADRGSRPVGRAQGFYVFAALDADAPALLFSMNVVLPAAAAGPYGGSTVAVMGRDDFVRLPVRELPVVGGTGRFRMARGYALVRTAGEHGKNAVLEIDLFVHAPYW